jgi:hypothetical protein
MSEPNALIQTIRDSFIGSQQVYTEGSCYHLYLILKTVFPDALPYYDGYHVVTKIGDKYYDITGEVGKDSSMSLLETAPQYQLKAPFNIYNIKKTDNSK